MLNITVTTFAGNLAEDPELRFLPDGKPLAEFRVAVNRSVRNKTTDEWEDAEPTWHNCKLFGAGAENTVESVRKGDRVIVHGEIKTEAWIDKETSEKRTKQFVDVEECGPSNRWATAKVTRNTRGGQD